MKTISVLTDFSEFPGLRNCDISENSGEEFYHNVLNQAFKESYEAGEKLQVNLDNTAGYASSFLDQAFGSLIYDFTLSAVNDHIEIVSSQEPHWKEMLLEKTFPQWEKRRQNSKPPKVTKNHAPWFRMINDKMELKAWEQCAVA